MLKINKAAFKTSPLDRLKVKLSLEGDEQDALLEILLEDAANSICLYISQDSLPGKLQWIAEEIAIKRYRKIGSEGLKSESIDVIKNDFESNPIGQYRKILDEYKASKGKKVRFI